MRFAWQLKYSKAFAKQAAIKRKSQEAKKMNINSNISEHIKRMEESLKQDGIREDLDIAPTPDRKSVV